MRLKLPEIILVKETLSNTGVFAKTMFSAVIPHGGVHTATPRSIFRAMKCFSSGFEKVFLACNLIIPKTV